ncbi:hypothetical protein [Chryseobacterium culicis]|uniref:Uncharacterized protein n=1 Tax=Chryseobacterium culicis TaxID=680127 RepID=A0A1H6IRM3_CHRCI|nr:hypothetical protein [Chryseobacterium culicis]SEH49282.1 hypothetical protein SAMN05421593_0115 [Chryseobacterium culicis]
MEKIKKAYYYFFYKIYKSIEYTSELVGGAFWTDFKTGLVVGTLEIWLLASGLIYYSIIKDIKLNLTLTNPIVLIPLILLLILNYFAFIRTDVWKKYNAEFDKLPKDKNKKGAIIVWAIIAFITINFFGSAYYLQKYVLKMH